MFTVEFKKGVESSERIFVYVGNSHSEEERAMLSNKELPIQKFHIYLFTTYLGGSGNYFLIFWIGYWLLASLIAQELIRDVTRYKFLLMN